MFYNEEKLVEEERQKLLKRKKGDIQWYLPNKKRPFTYSTRATSDLIALLYEEYKDLRIVYENINYDIEAKAIVKHYIINGVYQANIEY